MQLNPARTRVNTPDRFYTPVESLALQRRQSAFRLGVGWLIALISLVGTYAVAWDVQWHAEFGRDSFFSAPHLFIYGSIGLTGIIALLVVLYETFLYHRGNPAVTSRNSTAFMGLFHAPAGFYLVGFSMLSNVVAAPLDNYWHELYGIDVTIWAPFHAMAIVGSLFARFGGLLIIASEYNRHRSRRMIVKSDRFETGLGLAALAGLVFTIVGIFAGAMLLVAPSMQPLTMVFKFWGWNPSIYSTLVALLIPFIFISLVLGTGKPGLATLTAIAISLFRLLMAATVQDLTQTTATAEGLTRLNRPTDGFVNLGVIIPGSYPDYIILYGLLIDLAFVGMIWLWANRNKAANWRQMVFKFDHESQKDLFGWLLNPWWLAGLAVLVSLIMTLVDRPYVVYADLLQKFITQPQLVGIAGSRLKDFVYPDLLSTLPLVIVTAIVAGLLSRYFAILLRYQEK